MPTSSLFEIFVFSFAFGFAAVVSPGPVTVAIVSQAPKRGWIVGPMVAFGHSILELIIVILIAIGLSSEMASPSIQMIIAVLGGTLLFVMGAQMLSSALRGTLQLPKADSDIRETSIPQLVRIGVVTTASNPFWYLWWVTAAAVYLLQAQELGIPAVAAFYFGHISADFTWDTTLSTIIGNGRRWISDNVYRVIVVLCGAFFIYTGIVYLIMPLG